MGWLWASPPRESPAQEQQQQQQQTPTKADPAQNQAPSSEQIDPEVQKFLDLLKADLSAPSTASNAPTNTKSPPETASTSRPGGESLPPSSSNATSWLSLKSTSHTAAEPLPAAPLGNAIAEELLPTEMSCRQAFDLAWSCNSLGGQFNAVYRYGTMRSCSDSWNDFWFCMRTKSYTGELKENMIREHYRNKEFAKYGSSKPSSEDIWESRTEKLSPATAFSQPIEVPVVADDEWRQAESARRREIRHKLGYDSAPS